MRWSKEDVAFDLRISTLPIYFVYDTTKAGSNIIDVLRKRRTCIKEVGG